MSENVAFWVLLEEGDGASVEGDASSTPVEVLRTGTFEDSAGREVTITEEDLASYVAQFESGAAGQAVPVDVDHERKQAAGWVRALWVEGEKLLARVDWNALGQQLVGDQVYRYVSGTLDTARKVIKSISLVNFPAVKGLAALELQESDGRDASGRAPTEQEETMAEMNEEELREEIRAEERARVEAELAEREQFEVELRERVRAEERARAEAELAERRQVETLAVELCSGDASRGAALSARPEDVSEVLLGLDEEQRVSVVELLRGKVVQFGEIGSSREGEQAGQVLPAFVTTALVQWLEAGDTVAEFFKMNPELGEMGDYDLKAFEG